MPDIIVMSEDPGDRFDIAKSLKTAFKAIYTALSLLLNFRVIVPTVLYFLLLMALALLTAATLLVITGDGAVAPYLVPTFAVGLLLSVLLDSGVASVVTPLMWL